MDISWLGHACVRVRTQHGAVVMDPCDKQSGFDMGRPTADIVTVSHADPHHSYVGGVRGDPVHITGPGEYEISGVQIIGIATHLRPATEGVPPERNVAYMLEAEDLSLAHLGGLGTPLTAEQTEQLSNVDIVMLPIGGGATLDPEQAARVVRDLDPSVVIPLHYPTQSPDGEDGPLKAFISSLGVEPGEPVRRVSIQRRGLGEGLRLVLLEPRG